MSETGCIFCHSDSGPVVIDENGFTGRRCLDCGLIYISPRPSPQVITQLYNHDAAHLSAEKRIVGRYPAVLKAKHNLAIIKRHIRHGRLLEIGAGAGYFACEAQKEGFVPYTVELNPVLIQFINEQHKIICKSSLDDFADMQFEIIYHCDVLSHLYDPVAEFKRIKSLLADNGLLVFETGNLADAGSGYFRFIDRFQYPDHLFFFGRKSIKHLLEDTGFDLIEIHSRNILFGLISLQLRNRLGSIFSFLRSKPQQTDISSGRQFVIGSRKPRLVREFHGALVHTFIYGLGRIHLPNCPQTLLVIARKK